jgi:hypothetical protein
MHPAAACIKKGEKGLPLSSPEFMPSKHKTVQKTLNKVK